MGYNEHKSPHWSCMSGRVLRMKMWVLPGSKSRPWRISICSSQYLLGLNCAVLGFFLIVAILLDSVDYSDHTTEPCKGYCSGIRGFCLSGGYFVPSRLHLLPFPLLLCLHLLFCTQLHSQLSFPFIMPPMWYRKLKWECHCCWEMKARGLDKFKACLLDALTCVPTIANFIAPFKSMDQVGWNQSSWASRKWWRI